MQGDRNLSKIARGRSQIRTQDSETGRQDEVVPTYGEQSVFDLAAAHAFGIIRNHTFVDGNERTGFLAAYVFLGLNGWELMSSEAEAVAAVLALAKSEMDEAGFADWLKTKSAVRVQPD